MFFNSANMHHATSNKKGEVALAFSALCLNIFRIPRSLVFVGMVSHP